MTTKSERQYLLMQRLNAMGFTLGEIAQLRRIQMTLHRWAELECGDGNDYASWAIERDEATDKPYMVTYPHDGKSHRHAVPDREKGALKRLKAIMANHPAYVAYHQTDPRGCALYIVAVADIKQGESLDCCYTKGLAVCD